MEKEKEVQWINLPVKKGKGLCKILEIKIETKLKSVRKKLEM